MTFNAGHHPPRVAPQRFVLRTGGAEFPVEVFGDGQQLVVRVDGHQCRVALEEIDGGLFAATCDGRRLIVHHAERSGVHHLHVRGEAYAFETGRADRPAVHQVAHHDLRAPMPGVVTRLFVRPGEVVDAGAPLFALEAMKMETVVRAGARARVRQVHVSAGGQVDAGAIVVEVEDLSDSAPGQGEDGA
ncbi:MAG: biotin/lipoyl-containing protein [Armatimonadota bacterium]|nr:biotin/lipoyl-containing protein [Armatimonadota bacterium]